MKNKIITSAILLTILISGTAIAHKGATGIVKIRMDAMSAIGDNMKSISAMLTGKAQFNNMLVSQQAMEIAAHAQAFPEHFKEQTDSKHTEAAPTIWQEPDAFKKLSNDLATYANMLSDKAKLAEKSDVLLTDFKAVAGTCKSCHEQFRIKK